GDGLFADKLLQQPNRQTLPYDGVKAGHQGASRFGFAQQIAEGRAATGQQMAACARAMDTV
ncbi:MAG: hypothetical protein R6X09_04010, partial [Bacteroidales bacterium]